MCHQERCHPEIWHDNIYIRILHGLSAHRSSERFHIFDVLRLRPLIVNLRVPRVRANQDRDSQRHPRCGAIHCTPCNCAHKDPYGNLQSIWCALLDMSRKCGVRTGRLRFQAKQQSVVNSRATIIRVKWIAGGNG